MQVDVDGPTLSYPQNFNLAHRQSRELIRRVKSDAALFLTRADDIAVKLVDDAVRKRGVGRDRAWQRIKTKVGSPPLVATDKIVIWRWLQAGPISIVPFDEDTRTALGNRDVLEVNSLTVGSLEGRYRLLAEYWSLSITDHVLHRFFQRGGIDVVSAVLEAHTALCRASLGVLENIVERGSWALPAGAGAVLVQPVAMMDSVSLHMLGRTWIHRDMLRPEQEAQVAASSTRVPDFLDGPMRPRALARE